MPPPETPAAAADPLALPRGPSPLLMAMLAISVVLHVAALAFRLVDPKGFERLLKTRPLDVVLVNARGSDPPANAKALAQTSMDGGGDADDPALRSTSPLPALDEASDGSAAQDAQARLQQLQQQQQQLLAQVHRELARLPEPDPTRDTAAPDAQAVEAQRRMLLKLLGEIEKRINEDSGKPRKRYISPATREVAYALYYDGMRRRIEDRGTRDFPVVAGRKLYGELTMTITLDANGDVLGAEVVRGSGQPELDRRAVAIVRAAAPFGRFSREMHAQADQIVVAPHFRFSRDEGLATTMTAAMPSPTAPDGAR